MDHAEVLDRLEASFLEPGGLTALDTDPSEEAAAMRGHLRDCPACAAEHRAWHLAAWAMAENVPDTLNAPVGARERTLAAVADTGVARPLSRPVPFDSPAVALRSSDAPPVIAPSSATLPLAVRASRAATPRPTVLALAAAFAAALFLAGAVLGGPLGLVSQEPGSVEVTDSQAAAVALAVNRVLQQPDHLAVPLVDGAGAAGGSVLFDPASRELVVVSQALEAIPEGSEYGCYLERDGERTRVGRLKVVGDAAFWMGPMAEPSDAGRRGDRFVVVREDRPEEPVLSGEF